MAFPYLVATRLGPPLALRAFSGPHLTPKRTELLSLQTKFDLRIVYVECAYQSAGFEAPFNLQKDATQLGIGFSFFGYRFGDIHEEMVALKEEAEQLRRSAPKKKIKWTVTGFPVTGFPRGG